MYADDLAAQELFDDSRREIALLDTNNLRRHTVALYEPNEISIRRHERIDARIACPREECRVGSANEIVVINAF